MRDWSKPRSINAFHRPKWLQSKHDGDHEGSKIDIKPSMPRVTIKKSLVRFVIAKLVLLLELVVL
jgi:hypothetical protein